MGFTNKTVAITGAGKGIGREIALRLSKMGAQIVSMGRTEADLQSLFDEVGGRYIVVDLADAAAAREAARDAMPADFLVNCAGTNILQSFLEVSADDFDRIIAINLRAAMIVSQEFAAHRIANGGGGAIVQVSSMSAFIGWADHAAYCASKGGLDAMSRVMANELGEHGIRVNCVNPIITMTDLAAEAWSDPAKSGPVLDRMPIRRFAETGDIAGIVAFLLSDAAEMINGHSMPVDGGLLSR
ncbi:SDR family oxidoreductase [Aliiruegeria sabulilitoris]|uniref:SDR family oxidoreductase n=1 Tax=Aliiruegeria sabulilitoris TaxID=1510458 RepID=UPI00082F5605|nr:SDR family oxidoreductase [Aliiruegeria sabulilitoris]NDR56935.1 SDR family oxidoreductase [Pseudoruegeria sp. M32A2M]